MKAYITRDYDGYLMLSLEKPERPKKMWFGKGTLRLPSYEFPEIKSTDTEPTEAEITIKTNEKTKKVIGIKIPKELNRGHDNEDLYISRRLKIKPSKHEIVLHMLQDCDITISQATKMLHSDKTIEEDLKELGISL